MSKIILIFLFISNLFYINAENELTFELMLKEVQKSGLMKKVAVAGGDNITMLKCIRQAKDLKIADSILVGDEVKTKKMASEANIDISDFEFINIKNPSSITFTAVELVRQGKADIYAKGSVETKYTLKAILDEESGLKLNRLISGITVLELSKYNKLLIITDSHVRPYPTLGEKVTLINNAVDFARSLGINNPKVAPVTAIEKVNPKMRETEDASRLTKMYEIGQIKNCIVDGPLSFDLAVNPKIPKYKHMENRKIQGDADIILFPNIHSANIAYNLFIHSIKAKSATLLAGTKAPCVFTSRSGSAESKFNSIVLAIFYSEFLKNKK